MADPAKVVTIAAIGTNYERLPVHPKIEVSLCSRAEILAMPDIPPNCGVYFLIKDNNIQYVGKSVRLQSRIDNHYASGKIDFDRCVAIICDAADIGVLEAAYIRAFQPPANKAGIVDD